MEGEPFPSRLLVRFKDRHEEMAIAELLSLAEVFGAFVEERDIVCEKDDRQPFVHVRGLSSKKVCDLICSRSMLVGGFYESFAEGKTYDELLASMDLANLKHQVYAPGVSLKVNVEVYGASLTQKEKSERIFRVLSVLTEKVKVDLRNPTLNLFIFEQMLSRNNIDNALHKIFFCREISRNENTLQTHYQLKDRTFLNTTSMDPCLSFVMANLGLCRKGTLVWDPFVGSGSVLVSCAHFGSSCLGSDYDPRVFHGDTKEETIRSNFVQYGLTDKFLGVVRADFSQSWCRKNAPFLDAIITDPPYGVREGVKKIGRKPGKVKKPKPNEEIEGYVHIPMRTAYPYEEMLNDICLFAAKHLVMGGRLVYWHAADKETPIESFDAQRDLGHHECLELLNVGIQMCGTVNRRMALYKKIKEFKN